VTYPSTKVINHLPVLPELYYRNRTTENGIRWRLDMTLPLGVSIFVRFEIFMAVTMKNAVFWDIKNPIRTSEETHYVSATEPSRLMLCNI
jgi:hypothetical protein